jgi:hypothetical protein
MSYDHYEDEYHLTPTGWKSGTSYYYGKAEQEVKLPPDRVLTIVREVKQPSGWSPDDISWREKWRSLDVPPEEIKEFIEQFGSRPPEPNKAEFSKLITDSLMKK